MAPGNSYRLQYLFFYFLCFAVCYFLLFTDGLLLHQHQPIVFVNRLDFSLNALLLTDIGNVIIRNYQLQVAFDLAFIFLPFVLLLAVIGKYRFQYLLALFNVLFNLFYSLILTAVAPLSIHWFSGFMLIPVIFMVRNEQAFYLAVQAMRYIFIMFFFSAGIWKIRAGGIFNPDQMSGILVRQHAQLLLDVKENLYEEVIRFFVARPRLSYSLYLAGTIAELSFVIGFFTKRFDKYLLTVLILFIIFNFLLMHINYISWLVFAGCLWGSKTSQYPGVSKAEKSPVRLA